MTYSRNSSIHVNGNINVTGNINTGDQYCHDNTSPEKQVYVEKINKDMEACSNDEGELSNEFSKSPNLKNRFISAFISGGTEMIKVFARNGLVSVTLATLQGWFSIRNKS